MFWTKKDIEENEFFIDYLKKSFQNYYIRINPISEKIKTVKNKLLMEWCRINLQWNDISQFLIPLVTFLRDWSLTNHRRLHYGAASLYFILLKTDRRRQVS